MNLLFDFLRTLDEGEWRRLEDLKARGTVLQVWHEIGLQAKKGKLDKEAIMHDLGISASHFDKITSELLAKCYAQMFGDDKLALLYFLVHKGICVKLFYVELKRLAKTVNKKYEAQKAQHLIKTCIDYMFIFLPVADRDARTEKIIVGEYIKLFKGPEREQAKMLVDLKMMHFEMQKLFAKGVVKSKRDYLIKRIDKIGMLPKNANEELVFEFYWCRIYLFHAMEEFDHAINLCENAVIALRPFDSPAKETRLLRIDLRKSEFQYYMSRFEESYRNFKSILEPAEIRDKVPDRGYYTTKYIQVCLITGNVADAGKILNEKRKLAGKQFIESIQPRDIFSYAKYYLFTEQYEYAFEMLQIGFERNPRGKYFQYEVELRNLQTAYFFLTGQHDLAVQMCEKHIKYLRAHGFGVKQSAYTYFYILTKAIAECKVQSRQLNKKELEMLDRYQQGSYAVYGRLLYKMLGHRPN